MVEADYEQFSSMLDAVCGLASRGTYIPSAANTAMFFRALRAYSIEQVRAALDKHVADSRYVPVPNDVIEQIKGVAANDGRLGAEEAWASCLPARDESITIVWTTEMRDAWGVAIAVLRVGDEVGARMAFKEAYNRLVAEARAARRPAQWHESPGHDPKQRAVAIVEAQRLGRLGHSELLPALPAPEGDAIAAERSLLELQNGAGAPPHVREKLAKLRDQLTAVDAGPTPAQGYLEELQRRKDAELAKTLERLSGEPEMPVDTRAAEVLRRMDAAKMRARSERAAGGDDGTA